jgi:hypothetical protein
MLGRHQVGPDRRPFWGDLTAPQYIFVTSVPG